VVQGSTRVVVGQCLLMADELLPLLSRLRNEQSYNGLSCEDSKGSLSSCYIAFDYLLAIYSARIKLLVIIIIIIICVKLIFVFVSELFFVDIYRTGPYAFIYTLFKKIDFICRLQISKLKTVTNLRDFRSGITRRFGIGYTHARAHTHIRARACVCVCRVRV